MSQVQTSSVDKGQHSKVTALHLQRLAYIYVRQSTLKQVIQNQESQLNQYRLQQRAEELGWSQDRIRVIDSDLGLSASEAEGRMGFQALVAEISLGRVGIVCGRWRVSTPSPICSAIRPMPAPLPMGADNWTRLSPSRAVPPQDECASPCPSGPICNRMSILPTSLGNST